MGGPGSGNFTRVYPNRIESIIDMRRQGKSLGEIAAKFKTNKGYVGQICRKAGLGGRMVSQRSEEQKVADYVARCGFDYVGGHTTDKNPITVRCRECGRTFERQAHIFRDVVNGTWKCENECPLCRQDRIRQSRNERRNQAEHEAQERKRMKSERQSREVNDELTKRLAIHVCKNCGKEFCQMVTNYNSSQYCSESCQVRWNGRRQRDKRVKRMVTGEHDNDITLEKLYQRDKGKCYICGITCDWNDGIEKHGTFVAGQMYPSIDHVFPLSKGGRHTWENVKLACRGCNSRKRNSLPCPNIAKK